MAPMKLRLLILPMLLCTWALSSCEKGAMEKAGKKVDDAVDKAADKAEDATEKVKDKVNEKTEDKKAPEEK